MYLNVAFYTICLNAQYEVIAVAFALGISAVWQQTCHTLNMPKGTGDPQNHK